MTTPLAGRRVLVTRRPEQAVAMAAQLRQLGAEVLLIEPPEGSPARTVGPFANDACFAERNRKIRTRIRRAVVGLAVEVFVLQEQHGIVATNGRAQQAAKVQRS